jgi:hypothetical protein
MLPTSISSKLRRFVLPAISAQEKPETPREEKDTFTFAVARINVSDGRVIYDDRKGISGKPFV